MNMEHNKNAFLLTAGEMKWQVLEQHNNGGFGYGR